MHFAALGAVFVAALISAGCAGLPASEELQADASLAGETGTKPQPSSTDNLLRVAGEIEARGSTETALPLYERAAAAANSGATVQTRLADAYAKLGRYPQAESAYRTALAKDADYGPALLGLGGVLIRTGRAAEGLAALSRAAPLVNHAGAYDRLGVAHMAVGQPREALASFEQAHAMAPDDVDIATNLALASALSGHHDKAAALAKMVVAAAGLKDYHRRNLVLVFGISGREDDARLAAADALDPASTEQLLDQARGLRKISSPKARALALGTVNSKAAATR